MSQKILVASAKSYVLNMLHLLRKENSCLNMYYCVNMLTTSLELYMLLACEGPYVCMAFLRAEANQLVMIKLQPMVTTLLNGQLLGA